MKALVGDAVYQTSWFDFDELFREHVVIFEVNEKFLYFGMVLELLREVICEASAGLWLDIYWYFSVALDYCHRFRHQVPVRYKLAELIHLSVRVIWIFLFLATISSHRVVLAVDFDSQPCFSTRVFLWFATESLTKRILGAD